MVSYVTEDGMLGYVQPIGAASGKAWSNKTEVYGTGAFLSAEFNQQTSDFSQSTGSLFQLIVIMKNKTTAMFQCSLVLKNSAPELFKPLSVMFR